MTAWRACLLLWATTITLTLTAPRTAFADWGDPFAPGVLVGRSARFVVFAVIVCALALAAVGGLALWRMSMRSASLEAKSDGQPGADE